MSLATPTAGNAPTHAHPTDRRRVVAAAVGAGARGNRLPGCHKSIPEILTMPLAGGLVSRGRYHSSIIGFIRLLDPYLDGRASKL